MSPRNRSFAEVFAAHGDKPDDPDDRALIEGIARAIYDRFQGEIPDVDGWPGPVRLFYACYDFMHQVSNGGFAQAAYNAPELFPIVAEAYEQFRRPKAAGLVREAITLLPQEYQTYLDKGLIDGPTLEDVFEHFDDSPLAALDERIPEDEFWIEFELQQYARRHRAEFEAMDNIE